MTWLTAWDMVIRKGPWHVRIHEITCDLRIQDMTADVGSWKWRRLGRSDRWCWRWYICIQEVMRSAGSGYDAWGVNPGDDACCWSDMCPGSDMGRVDPSNKAWWVEASCTVRAHCTQWTSWSHGQPPDPVWSKMGYVQGLQEQWKVIWLTEGKDWRCGRKLGELPSLQPADCKCGLWRGATVEDIGFLGLWDLKRVNYKSHRERDGGREGGMEDIWYNKKEDEEHTVK